MNLLIGILGQIVGFLIFIGIIYVIYKSVKLNPGQFELAEGEEILKNVKGDYWEKLVVGGEGQNSGEFAFTNKRIAFRSTFQIFGGLNFDIPYNSIVSVEKSNVKGFLPVAFTVKTTDDKNYKFAIMKRDIYIDIINTQAQKIKEGNA